jgi:Tol biopolymer transport system component
MQPGTKLLHYEVVSALGKGGMGEVWCAKDTKLGREVAIKTLPAEFAEDTDRLARFEREAKLLASLNHPNIASIFGFEEDQGTHFLIMELVEGDTLAERIGRGATPVEESLELALQIADALKAAHEKGVIHRDLKPANIKVTDDNGVKVLDFGLAKAFAGEEAEVVPANSPTLSMQATQQGVILGTAAYMSPEQAKGRAVDKRADVFAFGCVLYEMLTGRQSFGKSDVTESLSAVISLQPEWTALPKDLHPRLREAVERCLEKDITKRFQDIGDVKIDLEKILADPNGVLVPTVSDAIAAPVRKLPFVAAVVLAVAVAGAAGWILKPDPLVEAGSVVRFSNALGDETFTRAGRPLVGISPDGTQVAYVADSQLYIRDLGEGGPGSPVQGTAENPSSPFFSPDGNWLGFWSSDIELKRVPVTGGTAVTIGPAENPFGVTWMEDDMIVYGQLDGIWRVSADVGTPERIIEPGEGEQVHGPEILPGGTHVLFSVTSATGEGRWDEAQIVVQEIGATDRTVLWSGGSDARYVPTGHLVYALGGDLFALRFDLENLQASGGSVPLNVSVQRAGNLAANTASAQYAFSADGTLIYVAGAGGDLGVYDLALVDREGTKQVLPPTPNDYFVPRLSPDDSQIAMEIEIDGLRNVWTYDFDGDRMSQLTFVGGRRPVWHPDGSTLTYISEGELWSVPVDFSGPPETLPGTDVPGITGPFAWHPDGDVLLYGSASGFHEFHASVSEESTQDPVLAVSEEGGAFFSGSFSPDGDWFSYVAGNGSNADVYIDPYPFRPGTQRRITTGGGLAPLWSRDGRELFYMNFGGLLSVFDMETSPSLTWRGPQSLFTTAGVLGPDLENANNYDVTLDGDFVMILQSGSASGATAVEIEKQEIEVVLNWFEELKAQVPVE